LAGEAEIDTKRLPPVRGIAAPSTGEWRTDVSLASVIAALAFALYLTPALLGRQLTATPEARVAVVAREMLQSGDYLIPTLGGEPRLNKPPLPYWLTAVAAKVLGREGGPTPQVLTRAVELTSALACTLAVLLVVVYGCATLGRTAGVVAALILGLSVIVSKFAWLGYGDTTLMLTCTAMFCAAAWLVCMPRPGLLCALTLGLSLGAAILVKGHVPLLLLLAPVLAEVLLRRSFSGRKTVLFVFALAIAGLLAAPWFIKVEHENPGAWQAMFGEVREALYPTGHDQSHRWVYYLYRLAGGLLPWTPALLFGWLFYAAHLRQRLDPDNEQLVVSGAHLRFFSLAAVLGFIGFYAIPKQQDSYLLPLLPPLALASGFVLSRFKNGGGLAEEKLAWSQLLLGLVAAAAIALLPLWPLEAMARTHEDAAELRTVVDLMGWPTALSVGAMILIFNWYLARQWVEGRALRACIVLAIAMYAGAFTWCGYCHSKPPNAAELSALSPRLRGDLDKLAPDVRVYAAGVSEPLLTFYLERPILTVKDHLRNEPQGQTGDGAPQRVLVGNRKGLHRLHLNDYIPNGADQIFVVPLPKDVDWPKLILEHFDSSRRDPD
jgi:4-amino-4-deoxy-L-arabinose transferase-like glycosyltransferase